MSLKQKLIQKKRHRIKRAPLPNLGTKSVIHVHLHDCKVRTQREREREKPGLAYVTAVCRRINRATARCELTPQPLHNNAEPGSKEACAETLSDPGPSS